MDSTHKIKNIKININKNDQVDCVLNSSGAVWNLMQNIYAEWLTDVIIIMFDCAMTI